MECYVYPFSGGEGEAPVFAVLHLLWKNIQTTKKWLSMYCKSQITISVSELQDFSYKNSPCFFLVLHDQTQMLQITDPHKC